jgi:hypothetical protein
MESDNPNDHSEPQADDVNEFHPLSAMLINHPGK